MNLFKINFIKNRYNAFLVNKTKGFSIIEVVIYLAIFTSLSIVVINSFLIVLSTFSTIRSNHDLLDSGSIAMDRISHEVRQSKSIDTGKSLFDTNSGVLHLNSVNEGSYTEFSIVENNLNLLKDDESIGDLLAKNIIINKLIFRHIITTNSEAVKIEIELQDTRSKTLRKENFYNTIVLRGAY